MQDLIRVTSAACGACLLLCGNAWGVDTTPEGGDFSAASTWEGGAMPGTGSSLYIKGPGEVVLSSGSYNWSANIFVLSTVTGGTATFRQTGGFLSTTQDFNIGDGSTYYRDGMGYVYITGGTNKLAGTGKAWTLGRRGQKAYAEVSGSGVLDCSVSPMYIAPSWGGETAMAEFHLKTGGTFIGTVVNNNAGGGAKFVFDGGRFIPTAANPFTGTDRLFVGEGGVVVDTSRASATIAYRLQANVDNPGGLVKLGGNTLTLSGENSYAGPTIVSNGALSVVSAASLPNYDRPGYVKVCSGAALVLGAGWTEEQKAVLFAVVETVYSGDGVVSKPEGGAFLEDATWARGTRPGTGESVTIRGPGEVVFSSGVAEWKANVNLLSDFGSTATFRQTGGFFTTSQDFNIGHAAIQNPEGWGRVYITGGTNKLSAAGKAWTVGRRQQSAYAEVSGSGVLDCSVSPMYIDPSWAGGSRAAEFHLKTGGTFIGSVVNNNVGGGAKFVFDGGIFIPTSATPFTGTDRLFVGEGGVVVDTGTRDVSISYKLQANVAAPGGLVKLGAGVLTLSGANAYAGPTIVSNGTLTVASAASLPNYDRPGFVTVCPGATLVLGAGWTDAQKTALRAAITVEEGGVFGDPQTFDTPTEDVTDGANYSNPDGGAKTGVYGLTLTGANDFGGLFTVKGGSLAAAFGTGLGAQDRLRLAGGQFAGWNGLIASSLGTGAGEISFVPGTASGFSALTGDTTVRVGGSATNVLVYGDALFEPGVFVLNDFSAKGTLTVENPLDLNGREVSVRVASKDHPAVLAGGVLGSGGGETLKTVGPEKGTLQLAGTNSFSSVWADAGRLVFGSASSNTITTVRVEQSDVTFDGSQSSFNHYYTGHLWSSQPRTHVVTNDATVAATHFELNIGTAYQSSGLVEAENLRLGPYYCTVSGTTLLRYYLSGGTLRGRHFYMGEVLSVAQPGTGELIQTGGLVEGGYWSTDFIVGYSSGQTSRYYLRGGRFEMPGIANDGRQKAVLIAMDGVGLLEVSGTGVLSAPYVYLCSWANNNTTAVGDLKLLKGGRIETRYLANYGTGCNSTVLLDGGSLKLTSFNGQTPVSPGFRYLKNLHVGINGFTLETEAPVVSWQAFTAAPNQTAPAYDRAVWRTAPAFVKKGTGVFTLAGTNTYRCATAVEEGTLALAANAFLPDASVVRVAAGATLDCGATAQSVKLLAGTGTVRGDVTVEDALAADAETLADGTGLTVVGTLSFGENAVIDVRGVDEDSFRASRRLARTTTPVAEVPALHINGAEANRTWRVQRRDDGRELVLVHTVGTALYLR